MKIEEIAQERLRFTELPFVQLCGVEFTSGLKKFRLGLFAPSITGKMLYKKKLKEIEGALSDPHVFKKFWLTDINFILTRAKWSMLPIIGDFEYSDPDKMSNNFFNYLKENRLEPRNLENYKVDKSPNWGEVLNPLNVRKVSWLYDTQLSLRTSSLLLKNKKINIYPQEWLGQFFPSTKMISIEGIIVIVDDLFEK